MISKEKIARINELAAKAKTEEGLTPEETQERDALRREYIDAVKSSMRSKLDDIRFVEDLPEEELAQYRGKQN